MDLLLDLAFIFLLFVVLPIMLMGYFLQLFRNGDNGD